MTGSIDRFMTEIILAAIDQKRESEERAETKRSSFKTPLTYRWLTRFRSMLSSAFPTRDLFHHGGQVKYSSDLMLISLSSLATMSKFRKNIDGLHLTCTTAILVCRTRQ